MIPAGAFRHLVSCQAPSDAIDEAGGVGGDYAQQFTTRAKIDFSRPVGEEQQGAGVLAGVSKAKFVMRANRNTERITDRWRLVVDGQDWRVIAVATGPVGRRDIDVGGASSMAYLTVDAEQGVAA